MTERKPYGGVGWKTNKICKQPTPRQTKLQKENKQTKQIDTI